VLTVQNPTAAETTNDAGAPVSFPAGEIQLTAQQVGPYLQADAEDEADPVRIARHEAFWQAWMAVLDEQGEGAVPGEGETGIGRAVRGLIGGPRNLQTIPATPLAVPGIPAIESDIFSPDTLAIVGQVPDLIPFPQGVGRLRTRLVMGVEGQSERLGEIAHSLVQSGAEIAVIANAQEFGATPTTQVVYFRDEQREQAQRLLDGLGTGELVQDETSPGEQFDVVVVIGDDFFDDGGDDGNGGGEGTVPGVGDVTVPNSVPTGGVEGGGIPGSITPGEPGGETVG
jgi:hypothetical protein